MRTQWIEGIALACLLLAPGCIEANDGSWIQFNMKSVLPPCKVIMQYNLPQETNKACTGDLQQDRFLYHYELWATFRQSAMARLLDFTVQQNLFADEQVELEKKKVLTSNGEVFKIAYTQTYYEMSKEDQATHWYRMERHESATLAVTSFSPTMYDPSKADQLAEGFYLGSHIRLPLPHNGVYYGAVDGKAAFGGTPWGGGAITLMETLGDLDSMMVTIDSMVVGEAGRPTAKPTSKSTVFLTGVAYQDARGVISVDAISPLDASVQARFNIYTELGDEEYF